MGYRIHVGVAKQDELLAYCMAKPDEYFDYYDKVTEWVELNDNLELDQFQKIAAFTDDEYPPYSLSKKDFREILKWYQLFLYDTATQNEKKLSSAMEDPTKNKISGLWSPQYHIRCYFDKLLKRDELISTSGNFMLDYFYLVRMYENLKDDECFVIRHG